jgi:hypothetical protein
LGVLLNKLHIEKLNEVILLDGTPNSEIIFILSEKDYLIMYNIRNDHLEEAKIEMDRKIVSLSMWNEEELILGTLEGEVILWNIEKKIILQKIQISNHPIKYINDYKTFVIIITEKEIFMGIMQKNRLKIERKIENEIKMAKLYLDFKKNILQIFTINYQYRSEIMVIRIQFMFNSKCLNICPKGINTLKIYKFIFYVKMLDDYYIFSKFKFCFRNLP